VWSTDKRQIDCLVFRCGNEIRINVETHLKIIFFIVSKGMDMCGDFLKYYILDNIFETISDYWHGIFVGKSQIVGFAFWWGCTARDIVHVNGFHRVYITCPVLLIGIPFHHVHFWFGYFCSRPVWRFSHRPHGQKRTTSIRNKPQKRLVRRVEELKDRLKSTWRLFTF